MKIDGSFSRKILLILVLSVASDFAYAQHQDGSLVKMVDVLASTIVTRLKAAGHTYRVSKEIVPVVIDGRMCWLTDVPDCKLSDVLEITYRPVFGKIERDEEEKKLALFAYGSHISEYGVIVIKTRWGKE